MDRLTGRRRFRILGLSLVIIFSTGVLPAADDPGAPAGGIKDNSFFIEEAYNQEQGVIQHILTMQHTWEHDFGRARALQFTFTEEFPIGSEQHQFSYALPFTRLTDVGDDGSMTRMEGIGDMLLNYRYQLFKESAEMPAVAPRFSLILPTGDRQQGLGSGELGYQFNLPVSKQFDQFAAHFNAGVTSTPGVSRALNLAQMSDPMDLNGYNLGGSLIWTVSPTFQPLVELFENWNESIDDFGQKDHQNALIISPGVRYSPYTKDDTQVVLGVAVPVGLTRDAPNIGVFAYFSIEHRLRPKRDGVE